jgi:hypothetical protein
MTVTLNLPPLVEKAYLAEAEARGLPLDAWVSEVLLSRQPAPAVATEMTTEEWVSKFKAWTQSHAGRNLPVLSDEAMSRESIYADRGL